MIKNNTRVGILSFALSCLAGFSTAYADVNQDFDSLGANDAIVERARSMDPHNRVSVVQKRNVDRNMRLEFGLTYGGVAGGDSYINTQNLGGMLDFHLTPHWSIGGRYEHSFSQLTPEGSNQFNQAQIRKNAGDPNYNIPDVDYPIDSTIGTLSFYPIYGKTNIFDWTVVHFDLYTLIGAGQMRLASGSTPTYTGGGGFGVWWNNHFTSRLELRYQTYEDQVYSGSRRLNLIVGQLGIGFLL